MSAVGFDIGNENCYVAAVISGGVEVLDNEYNIRATPSYISFNEKSRDIGVGAKAKLCTNWENTVFNFKKLLGKKYDDVNMNDELRYLPHDVCELSNGDIALKVKYLENHIEFCIPQLMAIMLTKLKQITENKLGSKIRNCVISVPVSFTDAQRRYLLDAAKIADLNPLKLMNESAAVALAYGFYQQDLCQQSKNVVFVDIGNSAMTVTACALTKENLKILATVWSNVGGRNFDCILLKHFATEFKEKYKIDVLSSKKAILSLWNECESVKKLMSATKNDVYLNIECFMNDLDVSGKINQITFVEMSKTLLCQIEVVMQRILKETNLMLNEIDSVEIVGGTCRMPAIKQCIEKVFGRKPHCTLNQDEAVARGCALQYALLSPSLKAREFNVQDISSYLIYFTWENAESKQEKFDVFRLYDKIPSSRKITFCINKEFTFNVYSVNHRFCSEPQKIGKYSIVNVPAEAKNYPFSKIEVKASIDIHGIFSVVNARMVVKTGNRIVPFDDKQEEKMDTAAFDKNLDNLKLDSQNDISESDEIYFELSVTPDVSGLSEVQLRRFKDDESKMLERDFKEKDKANARNALEEYIYDVKGKLKLELDEYVKEEDKHELFDYLYNIQNWLDANEDQDSSEYVKQLENAKQRFDPIFKRYSKWEQIFSFVNEYHRMMGNISEGLKQLSSYNMYQQDLENIKESWQTTNETVNGYLAACLNQMKHEDPVTSAQDLRDILDNFNNEYKKFYHEFFNRVDAANNTADSVSGDGNPSKGEETDNKKESTHILDESF